MDDLPFVIPGKISRLTEGYDGGFLKNVFPKLQRLESVHGFRDIVAELKRFGEKHSACMKYHVIKGGKFFFFDSKDDGLFPSNYAYEGVRFDESLSAFSGLAYHVTRFDGTLRNGDEVSFLHVDSEVDATLIPYSSGDDVKAVVLAHEHERGSGTYGVDLLVGNRFGDDNMPCFR